MSSHRPTQPPPAPTRDDRGIEHVSAPLGRVMADLELKIAVRALFGSEYGIDGAEIVIECADHADATKRVLDVIRALERAA